MPIDASPAEPIQTTLALGVPLSEVTFCVVDLETTGGSPADDAITEIGAVRFRGGERLGSFRSLVDPGRPIPPYIAHLTGIDDRLVAGAPAIEQVLPAFLEFVRGAVFVAHNAHVRLRVPQRELRRLDYPALPGPADLHREARAPSGLARRAEREARRRSRPTSAPRTTPTHRALDDAEACAEVLQGLLDVGGHLGILTLGDLARGVRARGRRNFGKIALADTLPHAPGVYLFRDRDGRCSTSARRTTCARA